MFICTLIDDENSKQKWVETVSAHNLKDFLDLTFECFAGIDLWKFFLAGAFDPATHRIITNIDNMIIDQVEEMTSSGAGNSVKVTFCFSRGRLIIDGLAESFKLLSV